MRNGTIILLPEKSLTAKNAKITRSAESAPPRQSGSRLCGLCD